MLSDLKQNLDSILCKKKKRFFFFKYQSLYAKINLGVETNGNSSLLFSCLSNRILSLKESSAWGVMRLLQPQDPQNPAGPVFIRLFQRGNVGQMSVSETICGKFILIYATECPSRDHLWSALHMVHDHRIHSGPIHILLQGPSSC